MYHISKWCWSSVDHIPTSQHRLRFSPLLYFTFEWRHVSLPRKIIFIVHHCSFNFLVTGIMFAPLNPLSWGRRNDSPKALDRANVEDMVKLSIRMWRFSVMSTCLLVVEHCYTERGHYRLRHFLCTALEIISKFIFEMRFLSNFVSVCQCKVFTGFSGHGNSNPYIIPLLKTENVDLWSVVFIIIYNFMISSINDHNLRYIK